ncbi:MAG: sirohydrochlorin cobaltochelatase [Clostridiales bacterium]|jgi:sirohydrochlorin cobaltochelatase|nr:sirohydrochlorin cobaltochelatase [Clostridiales bacterium]
MRITKSAALLLMSVLTIPLFTACSGNNIIAPAAIERYEEGVSDADDIVNTTAAEKVILAVSFGTSYNQSRSLTIGGIETAIQNAYPDYQVRRAFTSQIIIDKLAKREGLNIDNLEDALNRLVLDNVKEVVVQPTHVMPGAEYDDVIAGVTAFANKFESLKVGKPLLTSDADYDAVAELIVSETAQFRADDTAIVFMGHGTHHPANAAYGKIQEVLANKGYSDCLIGTVEAKPGLEDVQNGLKEMGAKNVVLRPLMVVAGDHANNDMAGDEEDAWKVILTEDGYSVQTVIEGLGQIKGVRDIYIQHVADAINSDPISGTAAAASEVPGGDIEDGTYTIDVETDSSMFRVEDCQLTAVGGEMTAVMTLSGTGYGALYLGAAEQAAAGVDNQYAFTLLDGKHSFTIPVSALETEINCAALGLKSGNWADHVIVFKTPAELASRQIDVALSGGSGRASVESPATLLERDGDTAARIVWSSPNYSYMLVSGVEYLPVNTEGNSAFEIPIELDTDMKVIACTVAMSEPKEIEYVLRFDSSTIE